jgi:hypothetical protein
MKFCIICNLHFGVSGGFFQGAKLRTLVYVIQWMRERYLCTVKKSGTADKAFVSLRDEGFFIGGILLWRDNNRTKKPL